MSAVIGALRVNLGLNSAEFETGMKKVKNGLDGIAGAFAALGGVAVFAAFTAGIGQAVGRIEETRKLTAQLDQALANTGNTAKTSGEEISDFADKLERSTGRAAEEVLAVGTNLATFGFSREVFFDAIKLADDMSAAWGGDLKQNVEGLARALADPEKGLAMLTKRGITFTDEQKNMIAGFMKANDIIGAQGVVLGALNEQVSGVAAAGFDGLTAASANAGKALEDLFEKFANMLGVNTGLEMSLVAVAAALDFVSANLDVIARGAGVVGAALVTALGPAIWGMISTAATLMATTVIGAIRAIGIAIVSNPIGALITALAAAVTAAFLFRDEIKQAIGIDFVGIVQDAVNWVIGAFVGAFEAIKASWSLLPAAIGDLVYQAAQATANGVTFLIREVQTSLNGFITNVNGLLAAIKAPVSMGTLTLTPDFNIGNPFAGAADAAGSAASAAFAGAQKDYIGQLGQAFSSMGESAAGATANIAGLNAGLDQTTVAAGGGNGGGGAGGGVKDLKTKIDEAAKSSENLGSSLKSAFKGFVTDIKDGKSWVEALSDSLGKIGDKLLDMALDGVFSIFTGGGLGGGGGGLLGGLFGGIAKIFGFASGGTIMPGGSGGIDSQLVTFYKSPNERVDITKPGQSLSGGAANVHISLDNELLRAVVRDESGSVVGQAAPAIVGAAVQQSNASAPGAMARYQNNRSGSDYRT